MNNKVADKTSLSFILCIQQSFTTLLLLLGLILSLLSIILHFFQNKKVLTDQLKTSCCFDCIGILVRFFCKVIDTLTLTALCSLLPMILSPHFCLPHYKIEPLCLHRTRVDLIVTISPQESFPVHSFDHPEKVVSASFFFYAIKPLYFRSKIIKKKWTCVNCVTSSFKLGFILLESWRCEWQKLW